MNNSEKLDFRLPKSEILRRGEDFRLLFKNGKVWEGKYIRFFFLSGPKRQVGFFVPKKLGNAVKRNRAKRRMREVYRLFRCQLGNYYILMFAKPEIQTGPFSEMKQDMQNFIIYIQNQ